MKNSVRVRFAPSPTGPLHIGGLRTALFNYLFAKKHQGQLILRIEDTDRTRFVKGAEAYVVQALQWLGIEVDEGPIIGGAFGPYRQSERKALYQKYIHQLLATGNAYYAFDTSAALDAMRVRLKAARMAVPQYNAVSRVAMKNSLVLPQEEVRDLLQAGTPYVVRIKTPHQEAVRFHDLVRGWVKISSASLDDKVLMKSDGTPTYHFANVVDDYSMQITHVIRGEEWIPSTPIHQLLYRYLGWEAAIPKFVHLPLLLKPQGTGKLSKRDADQHEFPIFPLGWQDPTTGVYSQGFCEKGYLPEALLNFLALLGWSPGTQQEIFARKELIEQFSIQRVGKSGIKFDLYKAQWLNQQHLKSKPVEDLVAYLTPALEAAKITYTQEQVSQVCLLMRERTVFPQDFWLQGKYFFVRPKIYDTQALRKKWNRQVGAVLQDFVVTYPPSLAFHATMIKETLSQLVATHLLKLGLVMSVVRIAITGVSTGPDLMQSMVLIGREECMARIALFLENTPTGDA